jgi:hypothetical protein
MRADHLDRLDVEMNEKCARTAVDGSARSVSQGARPPHEPKFSRYGEALSIAMRGDATARNILLHDGAT